MENLEKRIFSLENQMLPPKQTEISEAETDKYLLDLFGKSWEELVNATSDRKDIIYLDILRTMPELYACFAKTVKTSVEESIAEDSRYQEAYKTEAPILWDFYLRVCGQRGNKKYDNLFEPSGK